MTDLAINVKDLSKRYRIGLEEESHDSLVKALIGWVSRPIRNFQQLRGLTQFGEGQVEAKEDVIWALKDISLEVKPGEVVGIIGRNGAGKSTLLKVLSKITYPTTGYIELQGRVSSLLEVGTGFHPELTGRENIYLNGTILGMTKNEIDHKFEEIVEFSGVRKFIDTPVKRYSSGMRVRLAFSVAAHLEPEILLVDEVLSVGDAAFQKKSLGKMETVSQQGRTVLFVSHNMGSIRSLCSRVIVLAEGEIVFDGGVDEGISYYLQESVIKNESMVSWKENKSPKSDEVILKRIVLENAEGDATNIFQNTEPIYIKITYKVLKELPQLRLYLRLRTILGETVFATYEDETIRTEEIRKKGTYTSVCKVPAKILNDLNYRVYIGFDIPGDRVLIKGKDYLEFQVIISSGDYRYSRQAYDGPIRPNLNWSTKLLDGEGS